MNKKIAILISFVSFLTFAIAEPPEGKSRGPKSGDQEKGRRGHHGPPSPEHHVERLVERLKLDDAQKQIVKGLKEQNAKTREEYQTRTESLMTEMRELHQQDSQDETRLIEIGREMGELRVRQGLLMKHFINDLKVHLNEEQLKELQMMKERMQKMGKMGKSRGMHKLKPQQKPTKSESKEL